MNFFAGAVKEEPEDHPRPPQAMEEEDVEVVKTLSQEERNNALRDQAVRPIFDRVLDDSR